MLVSQNVLKAAHALTRYCTPCQSRLSENARVKRLAVPIYSWTINQWLWFDFTIPIRSAIRSSWYIYISWYLVRELSLSNRRPKLLYFSSSKRNFIKFYNCKRTVNYNKTKSLTIINDQKHRRHGRSTINILFTEFS